MNVRQLSYFMEVYKQGSIAGAAKGLGQIASRSQEALCFQEYITDWLKEQKTTKL